MQRASYASVFVASILIIAKFVVGLVTGSVAILSSLMDSVLDLVSSVINLVAIRQAVQPADIQHRFGHGKAEAIAGLLQAAGIAASALFILFQAVERLITPQLVEQANVGIMVMVFSTVMTGFLVLYQSRVIKKTMSLAVSADSLHYKGDLFTNVGIIIALILVGYWDLHWADPVMAVMVAAYLGWNGRTILMEALDVLMDSELPEEERHEIVALIKENDHVVDVHDLRTRSAGQTVYLQFHIELSPDISLQDAHNISDDVEDMLFEHYPGAEVIIHSDPLGVSERRDHFIDEDTEA
ncbi:MAG: cation diffusion facilitator family transporter [Alphaproteobacteria bacterium]|nr:MAG: cation diffusion facilitator family transporter [Alphaproteobacteria bacterium]